MNLETFEQTPFNKFLIFQKIEQNTFQFRETK